ncbi:MAG: hypothetical protein A4E28_01376 [Methanocella sp. PtaU1.Bin125]|nr:MAG: hypothetical protein A4E28_01376 [Methanocella sp. PtaU1.Bin125]
MIRKVCIALVAVMLIAAIIPQSMAASNGMHPTKVQPYKGLVGADSPLYGFKLFIQHADVSLTGNASMRLHKMLLYGDERLAEACAMALANNTGGLEAALNEYLRQMEAINATMDDESIDDLTYMNVSEELDEQEDNLTDLIDNSSTNQEIKDLMNNTLGNTQQIKNGRPFIFFNNTSYFIPPGQMKKLDFSQVPPGLGKKGYQVPAPKIDNGTVYWPWDEGYDLLTIDNGDGTALNASQYLLPTVKGKGNGKGKYNVTGNVTVSSKGGGNGKGKK